MDGILSQDERDAIDDILNDSTDSFLIGLPEPQNLPVSPLTKNPKKCTMTCIGGPDLESGITREISSPKFCSNLICINCDHKVIRFPNYKWAPKTDYLFLRNNYPNSVDKNLIPQQGVCAYCCQCKFLEESRTKTLSSFDTTWACRGHN